MKKTIDIILQQDVTGLGYKHDLVNVKSGYARNYLIPHGIAILAKPGNIKARDEVIKQMAHKVEKIKDNAQELADSMGDLVLEIGAKAGESGKIFGAVTVTQVSDALKEKGFDIDRKKISFTSEVKMLGDYTAVVDLHKDVKKEVSFKVVEV